MAIKPKNSDDILKVFTNTEVGALIEHFESKVDLILDGVKSINQKLDKHTLELESHENMITRTEIRLNVVESKL